jgi:hypothetical protein
MPTTQQFFWLGLPVFLGFVALEFFFLSRRGRAYSWKEGATSFAIGIGHKLSTTYKLGFSIKPLRSHNPLWIAFHEWVAMAQDIWSARSVADVLGFMFGPPGWKPDARQDILKALIETAPAERQAVRLT